MAYSKAMGSVRAMGSPQDVGSMSVPSCPSCGDYLGGRQHVDAWTHTAAKGPVTPKQGMQLRGEGGSTIKPRVCIDAMPLFSALAVDRRNPPAQQSLLCHLLWLTELISSGTLA